MKQIISGEVTRTLAEWTIIGGFMEHCLDSDMQHSFIESTDSLSCEQTDKIIDLLYNFQSEIS